MDAADWTTGGAAAGMLLISLGAAAISHGAHRQRTDALAGDVAGLAERVTALEALKISVEGLTRGIERLGDRLADSQRLSGAELGRLADQVAAGQKLMDARLEAMREMTARELDELKHGVRNIRRFLEPTPRRAEVVD